MGANAESLKFDTNLNDITMKQLTENEVSIKSLVELYENAYMKVKDVKEESFRVEGDIFDIIIGIEKDRKFIKFGIVHLLNGNITLNEAAILANTANEQYVFTRLSAVEYEKSIFIESMYFMTYKEGLIAFQLIDNTKTFDKFTTNRIKEFFMDYI